MSVAALSMKNHAFYTDVASGQNIAAIDFDPKVEMNRHKLIALIGFFAEEKIVDVQSALCARAFIRVLPADRAFPKIAADGEGALALLWDGAPSLLLTIDQRELHAIVSPATSASQYLKVAVMHGNDIPATVLTVVPPR